MTWIKICGTTNLRDAQLSVAAGADALGFIFAPSPRAIDVNTAGEIIRGLRVKVEVIGVFVNQAPGAIAEVAQKLDLCGVQLHGDEPAEMLPEFRRTLGSRKIIKTLHIHEMFHNSGELTKYLSAFECTDAVLLDSGSRGQRGGTGTTYDWGAALPIVEKIGAAMPLIIAGGLCSDNVARAIERFGPWGVDVVSGVESSPGMKDESKVQAFIAAVRHAAISVQQKV